MSLVSHALSVARFRRTSPLMSLLRSEHLPVVLAVVAGYFPQGAMARPAQEIYALLDEDLRALNAEGFSLPRGPQDYVGDWVRNEWFIRRPGTSRTGETIEPGEEALAVLDAFQRWDRPHRSVADGVTHAGAADPGQGIGSARGAASPGARAGTRAH